MNVVRLFTIILMLLTIGLSIERKAEVQKLAEPIIVELEQMTVVGIQTISSMKYNLIPVLWERFGPRMGEIKNVVRKDVALEVSYDMQGEAQEETFFVLAGLIVKSIEGIPEGMTYKQVPAHKYAIFTHYGPVSGIYDTYDHIYSEIIANSAYEVDDEACHLEWYGERFKMDSPDSEFDIYVPVKERRE